MLILTKKLLSVIPDVYPHECEDGWLLDVNDAGTSLKCTNPMCPIKNAFKLKDALTLLGFRVNIGPETSLDLVAAFRLQSHMDIFRIACEGATEENIGSWVDFKTKLRAIRAYIDEVNKTGGFSLPKFMDAWGCESMGEVTTDKIFRTYNSPTDFYSSFKDAWELQQHVGKVLGISCFTKTVLDITEYLMFNKDDILELEKYFQFKPAQSVSKEFQNIGTITICITGKIKYTTFEDGSPITDRKDYAGVVAKKYNADLRFSNTLVKSVKYLINDEGLRRSKYQKVKKDLSYRKCVMTRSDIFQVVLEVLQGDTRNVYSAQETI